MRNPVAAIPFSIVLALSACDNAPTPTQPRQPTPPSPSTTDRYLAAGSLLAYTGVEDCEWGPVAEHRSDVRWTLIRTGDEAQLIENGADPIDESPYRGSIEGNRFVGKKSVYPNAGPCQLREAWISVEFAADFGSFEADEAWYWGPPEDEEAVMWRWSARRL